MTDARAGAGTAEPRWGRGPSVSSLARLLDHTPASHTFCTTKPRQPSRPPRSHLTGLHGFPDVSVLKDAQSQGRGEGAEPVRQQSEEPPSEICGFDQAESGLQGPGLSPGRPHVHSPLTFPKGREPGSLVGLLLVHQCLQHYARVLSGQVILGNTDP